MRSAVIFTLLAVLAVVAVTFDRTPSDRSGALAQEKQATEAEKALEKAIETGKKLFTDAKLGTSGKSCASCHANPEKKKMHLKDRVGDYPKYDRREKRVITLGTKLNQMLKRMVKGKEETIGSDRLVAIEAYLMDLNRGK